MDRGLSVLLASALEQNRSGTALDIGAHHGIFSGDLAESGYFQRVISFEPNPSSFEILKQNASIEPVNIALGAERKSGTIYSNGDSATASLLRYQDRGETSELPVEVDTLDGFLHSRPDIGPISFIKIDTQGNDLNVISGAASTLKTNRPIVQAELIFIPYYQGQVSPVALLQTMADLGYVLYSIDDIHETAETRLAWFDAVFVPKELNIPVTMSFSRIDDTKSYQDQIAALHRVCDERLELIERLHGELERRQRTLFDRLRSLFKVIRPF